MYTVRNSDVTSFILQPQPICNFVAIISVINSSSSSTAAHCIDSVAAISIQHLISNTAAAEALNTWNGAWTREPRGNGFTVPNFWGPGVLHPENL